ncbi:MAG: FtsQ-type POTRA domain-containing protein [Candidatus Staskawiczbacteria bacterium]|nr:FtsQ-type POTRA domain-containing protein [Candidatus Staskawiczbacteria bacterium]
MVSKKHHVKNKIKRLKNKKPVFKRFTFWVIILFFIIVFSFLYVFLFFSKIQVSAVVITGNNIVQSKDIEDIAWNNINKKIITLGNWSLISKSIFLTGPKIINENILNKFPEVKNVKVLKKFPDTINLQIEERVPFAVFCQTDDKNCFYIDKNGVIFEILEQIPQDFTIIRQLIEDKNVFTGEKVVGENTMDIIDKIKKNLNDNFQINVKEAMITTPLRLDIETSENWQIYFNLDSETNLQITKMNLLLKNEIPANARKSLQYIDLRFKDRAYCK